MVVIMQNGASKADLDAVLARISSLVAARIASRVLLAHVVAPRTPRQTILIHRSFHYKTKPAEAGASRRCVTLGVLQSWRRSRSQL